MPGNFIAKASQHPWIAGESSPANIPPLPVGLTGKVLDLKYAYSDLKPVVGAPYRIEFDDGTVKEGKLDDKGEAKIENPPGPGKAFFGYDQRQAFAYPERPGNPVFGFKPSTPEEAQQALQRYTEAETEYMDDNYFPDEIAAIYSGEQDYDDLLEDYEYFEELAPEAHDDGTPGTHEEILLTGTEGQAGASA